MSKSQEPAADNTQTVDSGSSVTTREAVEGAIDRSKEPGTQWDNSSQTGHWSGRQKQPRQGDK